MRRLADIRCFILDMDGTFYLGETMLPGALDFMRLLAASGRAHLFLTNNSSRSAGFYAEKLTRMGWAATEGDILTSGQATAQYLAAQKPGARVLLLGTPDLAEDFLFQGFDLVDDSPDFVVLGFDKTLTYEKLEKACRFIARGVPFIATHPDLNCPTEDGFIPDCGAMIAFIEASTGVSPLVAGKPNAAIVEAVFARRRFTPSEMAIVGDRIYTDVATGKNAGILSVLVLSGETKEYQLASAVITPDLVLANLGTLARAVAESDKSNTP
jgi:4-nitrophenyl phosphatase/NagD protein